jgi:TolB protein
VCSSDLVDITGNQIRQLTQTEGANENPTWSPDGRFLAFTSTRNKKSELFVMDADGSAPHRLADIPGSTFTPHWSN